MKGTTKSRKEREKLCVKRSTGSTSSKEKKSK